MSLTPFFSSLLLNIYYRAFHPQKMRESDFARANPAIESRRVREGIACYIPVAGPFQRRFRREASNKSLVWASKVLTANRQ
jgi:hypothetical protein